MKLPVITVLQMWFVAALLGGWVVLVQRASPENTFLVTMCVGILFSWVVGIRQQGTIKQRVGASTAFIFGVLVIALFGAVLTAYLRPIHQERIGLMLATTAPFAGFAVIFLLRMWAISRETPN